MHLQIETDVSETVSSRWRWILYVSSRRWYFPVRPHGGTTQEVRTSNLSLQDSRIAVVVTYSVGKNGTLKYVFHIVEFNVC